MNYLITLMFLVTAAIGIGGTVALVSNAKDFNRTPAREEALHRIGKDGMLAVYTFKHNEHRCFVARRGESVSIDCGRN